MKLGRLEIKWWKKWEPFDGITYACGAGFSRPFRAQMTSHRLCAGCKCECHTGITLEQFVKLPETEETLP